MTDTPVLSLGSLHQLLEQITSLDDLQQFHADYISKKGQISAQFKKLKDMPPQDRKARSAELKEIKETIEHAFFAKQDLLKKQAIDTQLATDPITWTFDGLAPQRGHMSLLARERRTIEDIFRSMGYRIAYGDEIVTKYENFESVNIPLTHPATEMQDNFYMNQQDEHGEYKVFRAHTSAYQTKLMHEVGAPLKALIPGRVYRNENMDATHDCAFWQIEGLLIDKDVSIAHFKHAMYSFLHAYYGDDVQMRMRPAYFPFVEPGFEIDARHGDDGKRIEILGAGMIHPNVLREGGIDSDEYSGFAFGLGMTRMVAIKHQLSDIRVLTNGDLRFVRSFAGVV